MDTLINVAGRKCFSQSCHIYLIQYLGTGASLWGLCGVWHPLVPDCWEISKISACIGKFGIGGGVREASIFMPILQTISQLH